MGRTFSLPSERSESVQACQDRTFSSPPSPAPGGIRLPAVVRRQRRLALALEEWPGRPTGLARECGTPVLGHFGLEGGICGAGGSSALILGLHGWFEEFGQLVGFAGEHRVFASGVEVLVVLLEVGAVQDVPGLVCQLVEERPLTAGVAFAEGVHYVVWR